MNVESYVFCLPLGSPIQKSFPSYHSYSDHIQIVAERNNIIPYKDYTKVYLH